jgi:hypothetical protein
MGHHTGSLPSLGMQSLPDLGGGQPGAAVKPYRKYPPDPPNLRRVRWLIAAFVVVLVLNVAGQTWH